MFNFQYAEDAAPPPTNDENPRLRHTSDGLRPRLNDGGRHTDVSTAPVGSKVFRGPDLRACNGCAEEYATKLGADAAIAGEVQKVSNLILDINVYLKRLTPDSLEQAFSVDPSGNTRESFDRGIKYPVKNRLLERAD